MYEALTVEQIKTNILNRLTTNLQTREGSYTNDVISAAAAEIAACYHSMDALVPSFYLDETSGAYIDRQAAVVGIARKEGSAARLRHSVHRQRRGPGPRRDALLHGGGAGLCPGGDRDPGRRDGEGRLVCQEVGRKGNIAPGEITQTLRNYSGIDGYTNEAAAGGVDGRATRRCWSAIWPGCAGRPPRAIRITISSGRTAWRAWGPPGSSPSGTGRGR